MCTIGALPVRPDQRDSLMRLSKTRPKVCAAVSWIVVADLLWASCVYGAPPTTTAANSDAGDRLHSGPNSRGLGVEHWNWTLDQLNQAIRTNPKSATVWLERGNYYMNDTETEHAMADFNKAIAIDPHCGKAYIGRNRLYQFMRKWPLAFSELQTAAKMAAPEIGIDAMYESAFLHKELQQNSEALAEYGKVLKSGLLSKKRLACAFMQRGEVNLRMKKPEAATSDFSAALKSDPKLQHAYLLRARLYFSAKKFNQALADYSYIIHSDPEKFSGDGAGGYSSGIPEALRERANVYQAMGLGDLARKDRAAALSNERQTLDIAPFRLP